MKTTIVSSGYKGITSAEIYVAATKSHSADSLLLKRRNEIWRTEISGVDVVVKSFGSALMGQAVYAVRTSKARRSFEFALEIRYRGFYSPAPIGYMERRAPGHILMSSVYICEYISDMSLEDAFAAYGDECIEAFAAFVVRLHKSGIRHDDLNSTNVRVRRSDDGEFRFSLIDLNRMRIYPEGVEVPMHECFANVSRFTYDNKVMETFAHKYAALRGLPEGYGEVVMQAKLDFDHRLFRRKTVLHALGRAVGLRKGKN